MEHDIPPNKPKKQKFKKKKKKKTPGHIIILHKHTIRG